MGTHSSLWIPNTSILRANTQRFNFFLVQNTKSCLKNENVIASFIVNREILIRLISQGFPCITDFSLRQETWKWNKRPEIGRIINFSLLLNVLQNEHIVGWGFVTLLFHEYCWHTQKYILMISDPKKCLPVNIFTYIFQGMNLKTVLIIAAG